MYVDDKVCIGTNQGEDEDDGEMDNGNEAYEREIEFWSLVAEKEIRRRRYKKEEKIKELKPRNIELIKPSIEMIKRRS